MSDEDSGHKMRGIHVIWALPANSRIIFEYVSHVGLGFQIH